MLMGERAGWRGLSWSRGDTSSLAVQPGGFPVASAASAKVAHPPGSWELGNRMGV